MRKLTVFVSLMMSLAGCASGPAPATYGNFVQDITAVDGKIMADDVAKKMAVLFPPALTRINLQQTTSDAFGTSLVGALRTKGYALAEFKPAQSRNGPGSAATSGGVALAYVVDQQLDAKSYRITVHINSQLLSRLYEAKGGGIAPAGYWVRKE